MLQFFKTVKKIFVFLIKTMYLFLFIQPLDGRIFNSFDPVGQAVCFLLDSDEPLGVGLGRKYSEAIVGGTL